MPVLQMLPVLGLLLIVARSAATSVATRATVKVSAQSGCKDAGTWTSSQVHACVVAWMDEHDAMLCQEEGQCRQQQRQQRRLQQMPDGTSILGDTCNSSCAAEQRAALRNWFELTGGSAWSQDEGWSTNSLDHCSWYGVSCCTNSSSRPCALGAVTELLLSQNGLVGSVAALSALQPLAPSLELLDVNNNNLTGSIPDDVSVFTALKELNLDDNFINGTFPAVLLSLSSMEYITVSGNQLTGALPSSSQSLEPDSIMWLDVSHNHLTGGLPKWILQGSLRFFDASHNMIGGSVPSMPGTSHSSISVIDISFNQLEGTIPESISNLWLSLLDISNNRLSGSIPASMSRMRVYTLRMANNSLSGSLPSQIAPSTVRVLDLSANPLVGTLPSGMTTARSLEQLFLANTNMSGVLPEWLQDLSELSLLDLQGTQLRTDAPAGATGDALLPSWLYFNPADRDLYGSMACPAVVTQPKDTRRQPLKVLVSPFYYRFWGCKCMQGYEAETIEDPEAGGIISMECVHAVDEPSEPKGSPSKRFPWWGVLLIAVGGVAAMVLGAFLVFGRFKPGFSYRHGAGKNKPPSCANGKPVTLVLTDVEGSTELWEWDTEVMSAAIDMHDRLLRQYMAQFFGYEVQTEGDAFLVAFHEPFDAVAWCLTTQLALNNCPWPRELFRHQRACIETVDELQEAAGMAMSSTRTPNPQECLSPLHSAPLPDVAPSGMSDILPTVSPSGASTAMLTSMACHINDSQATMTLDPIMASSSSIPNIRIPSNSQVPDVHSGGGASFDVPAGVAGYVAGRSHLSFTRGQPGSMGGGGNASNAYAPNLADWARYSRQGVMFRGLRVRMGIATGMAEVVQVHKVTGRAEYFGEVTRRAQSISDMPSGGQILLDSHTFAGIHSALNELGAAVIEAMIHRKVTLPKQVSNKPYLAASASAGGPMSFSGVGCEVHEIDPEELNLRSHRGSMGGDSSRDSGRGGKGSVMDRASSAMKTVAALFTRRANSSVNLGALSPEDRNYDQVTGDNAAHLMSLISMGPVSMMNDPNDLDRSGSSPKANTGSLHASQENQPPNHPSNTSAETQIASAGQHAVSAGQQTISAGQQTISDAGVAMSTDALDPQLNLATLLLSKPPLNLPRQASWGKRDPTESWAGSNSHLLRGDGSSAPSSGNGGFTSGVNTPVADAHKDISRISPVFKESGRLSRSSTANGAMFSSPTTSQPQHNSASTNLWDSNRPTRCDQYTAALPMQTAFQQSSEIRDDASEGIMASQSTLANAHSQLSLEPNFPHAMSMDAQAVTGANPSLSMSADAQPRVSPTRCGGTGSWTAPATVANQLTTAGLGSASAAVAAKWADITDPQKGGGASAGRSHLRTLPTNPGHLMAQETGHQGSVTHPHILHRHSRRRSSLTEHGTATIGPTTSSSTFPIARRKTSLALGSRGAGGGSLDNAGIAGMGGRRRLSQAAPIGVVDMGIFELQTGLGVEYVDVAQVLVPGLEERSRFFPRLESSHQVTPGYFDAPATTIAPLSTFACLNRPLYPAVTLVFCAIERYHDMCAVSRTDARDVLDVYNDAIRRTLLAAKGYECQELEGSYMIVFGSAADALEWCLTVQEVMMEVPWTSSMLNLPGMSTVFSSSNKARPLLHGPRVKMGVYKGIPTKVVPHSTTGRADYFGPLVNRAARFCHAAAQGGQVIASMELVHELLGSWLGRTELLTLPIVSHTTTQLVPIDKGTKQGGSGSYGLEGGSPQGSITAAGPGKGLIQALDEVPLPLNYYVHIDNSKVEPSPWAYPADLQARRNRQAALDAAAEAAAQPPLPGDASASVAPAEASGAATGAAGDLLAETSATSLAAALLPPGMNSSNNLPSSASLAASRTNSMGQGEHHHLEQQLSGLLTRASHHPAGGHIMELDMGLEEGHDDEFAVQEVSLEKVRRMDVALSMLPAEKAAQLAAIPTFSTANNAVLSTVASRRASSVGGRRASALIKSHGASHGPGSRPLHTEGGNAGARASMLRCSTGNYSTSTVASLSYMLQPSPTLGPAQRRVSFALLGSKEGSVHRGEANAHHVVQIGPRPCMDPQQPSTAGALTRLSHLGTDGGLGDGVGIGDYGSKALVYLPQAAIAKRSAANKWLWAKEITVTDLGIYRFKGVMGQHAIVCISSARIAERPNEPKVKKAKGERLEPGRGPIYKVVLRQAPPTTEEAESMANQAASVQRQHEQLATLAAMANAAPQAGSGPPSSFTSSQKQRPSMSSFPKSSLNDSKGSKQKWGRSATVSLAQHLSVAQLGAVEEVVEAGTGGNSPQGRRPSGNQLERSSTGRDVLVSGPSFGQRSGLGLTLSVAAAVRGALTKVASMRGLSATGSCSSREMTSMPFSGTYDTSLSKPSASHSTLSSPQVSGEHAAEQGGCHPDPPHIRPNSASAVPSIGTGYMGGGGKGVSARPGANQPGKAHMHPPTSTSSPQQEGTTFKARSKLQGAGSPTMLLHPQYQRAISGSLSPSWQREDHAGLVSNDGSAPTRLRPPIRRMHSAGRFQTSHSGVGATAPPPTQYPHLRPLTPRPSWSNLPPMPEVSGERGSAEQPRAQPRADQNEGSAEAPVLGGGAGRPVSDNMGQQHWSHPPSLHATTHAANSSGRSNPRPLSDPLPNPQPQPLAAIAAPGQGQQVEQQPLLFQQVVQRAPPPPARQSLWLESSLQQQQEAAAAGMGEQAGGINQGGAISAASTALRRIPRVSAASDGEGMDAGGTVRVPPGVSHGV